MITKGKQAKEKLLEGINETVNTAKITLGAKGKTVLIADQYGVGFDVTKDGVSVIKQVSFDDDLMNLGADFVKNASIKTVNEAGDGTTTTSILTQSMCNDIYKEINLGKNANQLIEDLKDDLNEVKKFISEKSMKLETTDEVKNIAKISSNNDEEIGSLMKSIYDEAGLSVTIDITESDDVNTTYEIVNGFTMKETGYASTQFINNREKGRVEFSNPKVYLLNGKVKTMSNDLIELFSDNADRNSETFQPLVLIVEDIEEMPLREIVAAYSNEMLFNIAVVKTNLIYEDRKNAFIDASTVIDAEYSEDRFGYHGECEKVVIESNSVTFINGKGNTKKHIAKLKRLKKNISTDRRIFALESNASIIKVGGKLGTEIYEKKDRIEDAVCAVRSAVEEGYCPGGSTVYLFAHFELNLKTEVMKNALLSCYKQLMLNAELEPFYYLRGILDEGFGFGYNLVKDEVTSFYDDGIFDSTKVLRVSLENAVHTACNFALIDAVISK